MRSFVKVKSSQIGEITLSFTYIGKSQLCGEFHSQKNVSIPIRENKILAKISEFTVYNNMS